MSNTSAARIEQTPPRFIRAKYAHGYLGMCRDEFNKTVRPYVREFPIGKQGVAFDRHDLDEWADRYIETAAIDKAANQDNNRPRSERRGESVWREKRLPASTKKGGSGKSTRSTGASAFEKALALVIAKKQSST